MNYGPIWKLISFLGTFPTNSETATTNIPNPSCIGIEFTGLRPAFFEESSCQQSFLTLALLEFPAIFFDQACLKLLSDISQQSKELFEGVFTSFETNKYWFFAANSLDLWQWDVISF